MLCVWRVRERATRAAICVFCGLALMSVISAKARAEFSEVGALPADRLYVASITASINGYDGMTNIEKVRAIRLYVYQHTPVGEPIVHDQVVNLPLRDAYAILAKDGGVYAGGVAIFLSRFYKAAGFNSWEYNFGEADRATDATTLVEVDGNVIVQDAHFNFEYVDANGKPIPFLDLISRIADGTPPTAKTETAKRPWLFASLAEAQGTLGPYNDKVTCETRTVGVSCIANITLSGFLEMSAIPDFLKSRGWPQQFEYLMLYPISIDSLYPDGDAPAYRLLNEIKRKISNLPPDVRRRMSP